MAAGQSCCPCRRPFFAQGSARQGQHIGGGQLCPGQWIGSSAAAAGIDGRRSMLPIAAAGRSLPWARQGQGNGGRSILLPLPAAVLCPGQRKARAAYRRRSTLPWAMDWQQRGGRRYRRPAVNAAHCGRRPFFALGKARAREWRPVNPAALAGGRSLPRAAQGKGSISAAVNSALGNGLAAARRPPV